MKIIIKTKNQLQNISECSQYIKFLNRVGNENIYVLHTPYNHISIPCYKKIIELHNKKQIKLFYIIGHPTHSKLISREVSKHISKSKYPYIQDITIYNTISLGETVIIPLDIELKVDDGAGNLHSKLIIYKNSETEGSIELSLWEEITIKTVINKIKEELNKKLVNTVSGEVLIELLSLKKNPSLTNYVKILNDKKVHEKIKEVEVFNNNTTPEKIVTNTKTKRDWIFTLFLTSNFITRHFKLMSKDIKLSNLTDEISDVAETITHKTLLHLDNLITGRLTVFNQIVKNIKCDELSTLGLKITFTDNSKITIPLFFACRKNNDIVLMGNIESLQKRSIIQYYNPKLKFKIVEYMGKRYKNAFINGRTYPLNINTRIDWIRKITGGMVRTIVTNFDVGVNTVIVNEDTMKLLIKKIINENMNTIALKFSGFEVRLLTIIMEGLGSMISKRGRKYTAYTQHGENLVITDSPYRLNIALFATLLPENYLERFQINDKRVIKIDLFKFI